MLNKDLFPYLLNILMFLVVIVCSFMIYLAWNDPVEPEASEVDIHLPVISWERYLNLSKQPE